MQEGLKIHVRRIVKRHVRKLPWLMIPLAALLGSQGPLHQNPPHCMLNIRTGRHLRLIKVSKTSDDSDKFFPEKS